MSLTVSELRERLEAIEDENGGDATVFVDPPGPPATVRSVYFRTGEGLQTDYVEIHY